MKRTLPAFLLYCLITIALTYPLVLQLGSAFPHDAADPALNTWILWWNARTVPLTSAWWNAPAFHPVPGVLSFSENLLGLSLVATPIQWLGGSPLLAYNVVFLLTFPLCAIGGYALALELTGRRDASLIAGLLFGFAPYRMAHLAHIQVLAAFGMPFALVGLHRYLRDPRPRWLALFGGAWLLQALCNGYYLLFFSVLIGIWVLWFAPPRSKAGVFRAVIATGCLAALPLVPLLWPYKGIHERLGFVRDFGTIWQYGADLLGLFNADPSLAIWGWLRLYARAEGEIFPGLTIGLLVAAGLWLQRRSTAMPAAETRNDRRWSIVRRVFIALAAGAGLVALAAWKGSGDPVKPLTWVLAFLMLLLLTSARVRAARSRQSVLGFYAVAAFVMWVLSLGPAPTIAGEPLMDRGPYALLMGLPGFSSLRVPARFWMVSVLCLAGVGAIVFDRFGSRFVQARRVLAGIVMLGVLAEAWIWRFPLVSVPEEWRTQACIPPPGSTGAVMEIPLGDIARDVGAMYRSMSHGRPTVNGHSGYFPPHYSALRFGLARRDPEVLAQMAALGVEYVVIDRGQPEEAEFRRYVAGQEGAELVCSEPFHTVFRFRGSTAPVFTKPTGTPLAVASLSANVNGALVSLMLDGNLATRWESGPQERGMMVEIDLGSPQVASALDLSLGRFTEDFPRGLRIEASADRDTWREVWGGSSAGRVIAGTLRDPVATPLIYDLSSATARYLRLWLTQDDATFFWSIAELKVLGP